jgi:two-component system response regulator NreC
MPVSGYSQSVWNFRLLPASAMNKKIQILIADDHAVVRQGTRAIIASEPSWKVCGVARNGREAVDLCTKLKPDILVLDLNMSDMNGLEVVLELKRRKLKTEILLFSAHQAEEVVPELFEAGVKSYVRKTDSPEHLVAAIKSLATHKPYFTPEVSALLFARFENRPGNNKLNPKQTKISRREREILRLIAGGKGNKEVAEALGISVRTAETHRANILRKLNLDSVASLVRYAIRNKLIEP